MAARLRKALLAVVIALMAMMGTTAYADPGTPAAGEGAPASMCGTTAEGAATGYLPVNRWAEATTSFHFRLDADTWNDLAEKVERNGRDTGFMQIGNAAWRLSTDALYASSTFCPIDVLGYPLDSLVGQIGKVLTTSGLLTALAVITICSAVLSARKGNGAAYVVKELLKTGVVLGVLSAMILGGVSSTRDGPGKGSPWWWVQQVNTVVNSASGTVTSTVVKSAGGMLGYQNLWAEEGSAEDWPLTCTTTGDSIGYLEYLHRLYNDSYTHNGSANARASALPEMVSTMWESGVMPVWAQAQFGGSNSYSDHVFCFFLEARSHGTVSSNAEMTGYVAERLGVSTDEAGQWSEATRSQVAWGGNAEDQSLLGWAACVPSGLSDATVRGDWENVKKAPGGEECTKWWASNDKLDDTNLDWDEKSVGENASGSGQIYNYVASVHGKDGTRVGSVMFAYLVGSLIDSSILLLLSLLQLGSKLIVAFMVAGLFAALARSLAPGDDGRLFKKTGLQLIGAVFVSSCAGLLIAIIMMVAGVIAKVGSETFSPGTTGAILATCLGPAAGVFFLHWLFTSVMHVPSPFTIKGALAWGRGITTGAIGGSAAAGMAGLAAGAGRTARGGLKRPGTGPRPGDGRPSPGEINRSKTSKGANRHVFTHRSATEQMNAKPTKSDKPKPDSKSRSGGLMEEARAERDERKQRVDKEAKRLADHDGHLGEEDAWKQYRGRARSNLRRAQAHEIKEGFNNAVRTAPGRTVESVKSLGPRGKQMLHQTGARAAAGADAAHALAGWAAHHPARAAAAVGTAGWRTAAAGARTAAATASTGAAALRRMPAKKAVALGAGAALAAGAAPVAAELVATGAGAGWAKHRAMQARQAQQEQLAQQEQQEQLAQLAQLLQAGSPEAAPSQPAPAAQKPAPEEPAAPAPPRVPAGTPPVPRPPAQPVPDRARSAVAAVQNQPVTTARTRAGTAQQARAGTAQQARADAYALDALNRARATALPRDPRF